MEKLNLTTYKIQIYFSIYISKFNVNSEIDVTENYFYINRNIAIKSA